MKLAVTAVALATLLAVPSYAADSPIRLSTIPAVPLVEKTRGGNAINFDLVVENGTAEKLEVSLIEVSVLDASGRLITQRRAQANGEGILTVTNRIVEGGKKVVLFNPIAELDAAIPLDRLRIEVALDTDAVSQKYRATLDVKPLAYRAKAKMILPLTGRWFVHDGHDLLSHHRRLDVTGPMTTAMQAKGNFLRYAYDFIKTDDRGRMTKREPAVENSDFYCYGEPIVAPADGVVVESRNDAPESTPSAHVQMSMDAFLKNFHEPLGNYAVVDHGNGEYSVFAHMKTGSVRVKAGDRVKQGQQIGQIGFSGDSIFPHLHYQLQSDAAFGEGLPSYFTNVKRFTGAGWVAVNTAIDTGDIVETK